MNDKIKNIKENIDRGKWKMYTITVKIAANDTIYHDADTSVTGHMWYSISNGSSTESYGFAPAEDGMPLWEGEIKPDDDANYGSTYYTGTIVINQWQYEQLKAFGNINNLDGNPFDFSSFYIGTSNSCIDYSWKALNIIGMNPSDFEGQIWPTKNADNADAIYGGSGIDNLIGSVLNDFLDGGSGFDTYITGDGDTEDDGVIDHIATLTPTASYTCPTKDVKVKILNSGTVTVYDDEAGRYDPLVLDTNKDGFISTTPLTGSTTYFDITGDGLRERIGWISPEDALLTYDKNDNTIDRRDELYNQDAISTCNNFIKNMRRVV